MAKVSMVQRDLKRRKLYSKYKGKREKLLAVAKDKSLSAEERFEARLKLAQLPRNSSKNRIRNRCLITGRPRGVYRKFGLSRIAFRDLASDGKLPGVVKSSWWGYNEYKWSNRRYDYKNKNAHMRGKEIVDTPSSSLRVNVLEVLKAEGFIRGFSETERDTGQSEIQIELKYHEGDPVIKEIKRISKPGRRVYSSVKSMPLIRNGLGISIVSTPKGVMSDSSARNENVGGEILCTVF